MVADPEEIADKKTPAAVTSSLPGEGACLVTVVGAGPALPQILAPITRDVRIRAVVHHLLSPSVVVLTSTWRLYQGVWSEEEGEVLVGGRKEPPV